MSYDLVALKQSKLFANLSDEAILRFFSCNPPELRQYKARDVIHQQGAPLTKIFVITAGNVTLTKIDFNGNRNLIATLGVGDVYGQTVAFGDSEVNAFSITAVSDVTLLLFPKSAFYRSCSAACASHHGIIRNMIGLLASQANTLDRKISYLTTQTLRSKVARYLLEEQQPHPLENVPFNIPLNRESLADFFDVQRPSLSRTLTQMRDDGVIDFYKSSFKILDLERLRQEAQ